MASKSDKKTQDMITNYKYACEWICKNQIEYHLFHSTDFNTLHTWIVVIVVISLVKLVL